MSASLSNLRDGHGRALLSRYTTESLIPPPGCWMRGAGSSVTPWRESVLPRRLVTPSGRHRRSGERGWRGTIRARRHSNQFAGFSRRAIAGLIVSRLAALYFLANGTDQTRA